MDGVEQVVGTVDGVEGELVVEVVEDHRNGDVRDGSGVPRSTEFHHGTGSSNESSHRRSSDCQRH